MIDHEGGFGFVETAEGEVYFHRNSVVEGGSRSLEPGSRVRLEIAERESGEGWQAHHGPPDRQASPAGRTGLIRLRSRQFASWTSPQRPRLAHRFPRAEGSRRTVRGRPRTRTTRRAPHLDLRQ